jgi:hypothetical protein
MSRAMLAKPHPSLYLLPLLFLHFEGKHYVLVKSFSYIWKNNMIWKITKCVLKWFYESKKLWNSRLGKHIKKVTKVEESIKFHSKISNIRPKKFIDKLKKTHINIVHSIFECLGFQHDLLVLRYLAIWKTKTSCFLACLVSFYEHDHAKHKIYNR